jgi:hypothetical protein
VYTYIIAAMAAMVLLMWMWSSEEVERSLSSSEEEEDEDEDEVILRESSLLSIIAVHSMKLQGMDNRENRILGTEDDDFVHAVVFLPSEDAMMRGLWKCLCLHKREGLVRKAVMLERERLYDAQKKRTPRAPRPPCLLHQLPAGTP